MTTAELTEDAPGTDPSTEASRRRTRWIVLFWALVVTVAVAGGVLMLISASSAGAAGDCGGG